MLAPKNSSEPDDLFRDLTNRYAQYALEEGVRVRPHLDPSLPKYSRLSSGQKLEAIAFLAQAIEVFDEMKRDGLRLRDDAQLLWRTLRRLGMVPEADLFDKLTDEYSIEIYSSNHRHLFWNLRFLECFSVTLEQLLCQPWWELASRPKEILDAFVEITTKIITGESKGTVAIDIPLHVIEELDSEELYRIEADVKYISPLKLDGIVVAGVTVARTRICGSRKGGSGLHHSRV